MSWHALPYFRFFTFLSLLAELTLICNQIIDCAPNEMPFWLLHTCERCEDFDKNCLFCSYRGPPKCIQCKPGYLPVDGKCTLCDDIIYGCKFCENFDDKPHCTECLENNIKLKDNTCYICQDEIKNCEKCYLDEYSYPVCTKCFLSYTLMLYNECEHNSKWITDCDVTSFDPVTNDVSCVQCYPGHYFLSSDHNCWPCQGDTGVNRCNKCEGRLNSSNNQMELVCTGCDDNFIISKDGKNCLPCSDRCVRCSGDGKCLECGDGLYLNIGFC